CSIVSAPLMSLMRRRSPRPSWKTTGFGVEPGASAGSMDSPRQGDPDARTVPFGDEKARAANSFIDGAFRRVLQEASAFSEFCQVRFPLLERRSCGRGRGWRTHLVLRRRLRAEQMLHKIIPSSANHVWLITESVAAIRKQDQIEVLVRPDQFVDDEQR